jgi:hypothetical protein
MSANGLLETAGRANELATNLSDECLRSANSCESGKSARREFTIYRNDEGEIVCRAATPDEIRAREGEDLNQWASAKSITWNSTNR